MGDGDYLLAGSEIEVRDGVVRGLDDVLAGSALTMIEADAEPPRARASRSPRRSRRRPSVPARVLGLPTVGRLDVGFPADLVVLDDNLEIDRVCVGGEARVVA